ncbi:MAG: addiction module protein [Candidatus Fervidibacter sp.]|uniref:addiction module protein n=1 Tax=Candidatus Fervidibacter sp. TaxID=3100871 RepID=UPI00404A810F
MLFGFVVLGFPQQGQDSEIKNILRLMEERSQKLALIDSIWEHITEQLPDPYYQQNWEKLAERRLQEYIAHERSLGAELSPKVIEHARKVYRELFLELAKGYRRKTEISIEGGQSLILVTTVLSAKPKYIAKIFIFIDKGCFFEYGYGWGVRPVASIRPIDELEPVFSNLPTHWFLLEATS